MGLTEITLRDLKINFRIIAALVTVKYIDGPGSQAASGDSISLSCQNDISDIALPLHILSDGDPYPAQEHSFDMHNVITNVENLWKLYSMGLAEKTLRVISQ